MAVTATNRSRRQRRSSRPAFTLIELLVVISIVALLMAILLPTLARVRKQAKGVVCQSNLRQWGLMLSTYTAANEGRLFGQNRTQSGLDAPYGPPWYALLKPYAGESNDVWLCPMARKPRSLGPTEALKSSQMLAGRTFNAWRLEDRSGPRWIADADGVYTSSYGLSPFAGDDAWQRVHGPLPARADVPAMMDHRILRSGLGSERVSPPPCEDLEAAEFLTTLGPGMCINRHDGRINMAFFDWSVRGVGLKELWTLRWHNGFDTRGPWTKAGGVQPEDWPEWMRGFKDY